MKVLYICISCSPYGGSEDAIGWNLPIAAMRLGADVTVITRTEQRQYIERWRKENPEAAMPRFEYVSVPRILDTKPFRGQFQSLRLSPWLSRVRRLVCKLTETEGFDVVHQLTPIEFRAVMRPVAHSGINVVGPLGGGEYAPGALARFLESEKTLEDIRRRVNELTLRSASWRRKLAAFDSVFFANEETRHYIEGFGAEFRGGEVRTEIGVPKSVCDAAHKRCSDSSLNSAHRPIRLLYMGRLVPRKGVDLLLEACLKLKEGGTDFRLKVCGDGKQMDFLKSRANELGLASVVEFVGVVPHDRIDDDYSWCDVLVMPSVRETGGAVIAEALGRLKPVVSFDAFGARVILGQAPFCQLAEVEDDCVAAFAEAIVRTVALVSECERGEFLPLVDELCWDEKARRYFTDYSEILAGRRGGVE